MTSKILVIVNGPSYVADVVVTTNQPGYETKVEPTVSIRGGTENQAVREFYLGTNQTIAVTERYEPKELSREAAGLSDELPLSDVGLNQGDAAMDERPGFEGVEAAEHDGFAPTTGYDASPIAEDE